MIPKGARAHRNSRFAQIINLERQGELDILVMCVTRVMCISVACGICVKGDVICDTCHDKLISCNNKLCNIIISSLHFTPKGISKDLYFIYKFIKCTALFRDWNESEHEGRAIYYIHMKLYFGEIIFFNSNSTDFQYPRDMY